MRRFACGIALLVIVMGAFSAAQAGWVWRDGKWMYEDTSRPVPPAPKPETPPPAPKPVQPSPAPEAPPARPTEPVPRPAEVKPFQPAPAEHPATRGEPTELPDAEKPNRPEETKKPFWERAAWWKKSPEAGTDKPLFNEARADFMAGNYRSAEGDFKKLIKEYPTSPYREEAMWLRAEALFAREDYYKAYEQYEDLIEQYAGSDRYPEALRKEIEIAELYLGPVRRRVLGMPLLSGETEAIEILRRVYEHQPAGDLADDVILRIADYYWDKGQWDDAEEYYDKYCKEYPNGDAVQHAELRRALSAIERCRGPRYCTTSLRLAHDRLRQFQAKYPEAAARHDVPALLQELRDSQAQSLYEIAARYQRANQPLAAAYYAETLRERYPDSPWSEKATAFVAPGREPAAPALDAAAKEPNP
ncbi:MAG: outer membrane protein assembly factor BamD [Planctomycetes bacterium]|nr:outer membrane protein assembly factor BamD [Planctomycetota bacterium]